MGEDGGSGRGIGNWGLPAGRKAAERKRIKRTGVLENSPWERFLRSSPPALSSVAGDGSPSYLPEGVKAQAAEGEQQSSLHHLWGRQESEVRRRVGSGAAVQPWRQRLEEETHTSSSVE